MAEKFVLGSAQSILGILGTYAGDKITSAWVANEELKKLERSLNFTCPFIKDAENKLSSSTSSTEQGNEGIKKWLMELKNVIYDIEDLLDEAATDALRLEVMKEGGRKKLYNEVRYHLSSLKHKFLSPFSLSNKIKDLRGRLEQIAAEIKRLGIIASHIDTLASHGSEDRIRIPLPFINKADNILGRDEVKREIKGMVLGNGVEYSRGLSALAIVGVGGIGKTTVAQMIYADPDIDSNFDIRLWGCVSKPFNFKMVLKRILESIKISIGSDDIGQMVNALASAVRDKRYFLVLDDVWTRNTEEWKQLRDVFAYGGKKESVMLVTTRDEKVATRAIGTRQIFNLAELSFDVCMSIFTRNAFEEGESERYPGLVKVGNNIVEKCGGLPLAVQAVGSMLRGERDEREWRRIAENDLWKHEGVLAALRLSYNDLPSHLKLCFAFLSLYPKGVALHSYYIVVPMMAAQGLITDKGNVDGENWEETGERYLKELLSRSLLQEPKFRDDGKLYTFKMHDLVHDLALDVMGEELAIVTHSNDHPKVSRLVRHISWVSEHLSSKKEIPRELLLQAHQVRTFYIPYKMTSADKMFIQQVVSSFKCLRSLSLASADIEELPDSIGDLKHLRYLDLFNNVRLKSIPNSICKLLNLQTLDLGRCEQLEKLPEDIGKLINLTHLYVTLSSQSKYLIPKRMKVIRSSLRHLGIGRCSELISLLEEEEKDDVSKNIIFLTELRTLGIIDCPKFSPHLSNSLRYLTSLNELLIRVSEEVDGQMELPPQPTATVGGMKPDGLRSLKYLRIGGMQTVVGLPDVLQTAATSLRHLQLWNCARLTCLPEWLRNFKSLSHLSISNCPQLSTLPSDGFLGLTSLQELRIERCPLLSLRCSENGWGYWPRNSHIEFDGKRINFKGEYVEDSERRIELPPQPTATVGGMKPDGLPSLKYLFISWGLPDVLQTAATSLRRLHLLNCAGVESLPEWLRNFKSLSHLFIINCPQLSTLPSDGFLGLTSLQELYIQGCPHLSLRCSENGWDNWRHISDIFLDGKRINFKREYVEDSE